MTDTALPASARLPTVDDDRSRLPLSDLIERLALELTADRVSVADLIAWFDDRATLALMVVFAILNVLPNPPGSSTVLGLPLIYLSIAMIRGHAPRFPAAITRRSLPRGLFTALAARAGPQLRRFERIMRPRHEMLCDRGFHAVSGWTCLVLAVVLVLPIPLGNMAPAFCMGVIALATAMRDGRWVAIGWALSGVTLFLLSGLILGALSLLLQLALRLFS